jgi:ribosome biogenesis GTPase
VALRPVDADTALVEAVLPRRGALVRKTAGRTSGGQVLAAHVDVAWLAQGLDRGVNPGWLERAVALCAVAGVQPVVVLTKADLGGVEDAMREGAVAAPGARVVAVSAATGEGLAELGPGPGRTAVLLGASGAGKSTLLNALAGREVLATAEVRAGDAKGRHTTTHRELVVLPGGGLIIDTPGLRELGLWVGDVDAAYPEIESLSAGCRFRDCGHTDEPGCAVVEAVEAGTLDRRRYERYLGLQRELESLEVRRDAAEQRRRGRRMAQMIKEVKRERARRRKS